MKIDDAILNDACSELLAAAYQLNAQDELRLTFEVMRGSKLFDERSAQASQIRTKQEYDAYIAGLCVTPELTRAAIEYFIEDWQTKVTPRLELVEKRKQARLDEVEPDYESTARAIERRMCRLDENIKVPQKDPHTREEFETYRRKVERALAKKLEEIAAREYGTQEGTENCAKLIAGDIIVLRKDTGHIVHIYEERDLENRDVDSLIFSCDSKEIGLENITSDYRAEVLWIGRTYDTKKGSVDAAQIRILPDEKNPEKRLVTGIAQLEDIEAIVSNVYKERVMQADADGSKGNNGLCNGAKAVAAEIIDELLKIQLQKAVKNTEEWYAMPYKHHVDNFMRRHKLTPEQLEAIRSSNGHEGAIEKLADHNFSLSLRPNILRGILYSLVALSSRAIGYKTKNEIQGKDEKERFKQILDETAFKEYISRRIKEISSLPGYDLVKAAAMVKEQLHAAAQILRREYRLVKAQHEDQQADYTSPLLNLTFTRIANSAKIIDGKVQSDLSIDRALMYHDTRLYPEEPFSPPSEGRIKSIKLLVSDGCRYGRCTYCTSYNHKAVRHRQKGSQTKDIKNFTVKSPEEFKEHCLAVREMLPEFGLDLVDRLFLGSSDILGFPTPQLLEYLNIAKRTFDGYAFRQGNSKRRKRKEMMHIRQISGFARTNSIAAKSADELNQIVEHGLNLIFWGVETGSDQVLNYVMKGSTHHNMAIAAEKLLKTKMKVSVMVMPGLGGLKYYEDHVIKTAEILNRIVPHYIAFLAINPNPASAYAPQMEEEVSRGQNMPLTDEMIVEQTYDIMRLLNPERWEEYGRTCLVSAPRKPADKVAKNPKGIVFRIPKDLSHLDYLTAVSNVFGGLFRISVDFMPSALVPEGEFNRDSRIRNLAYRA